MIGLILEGLYRKQAWGGNMPGRTDLCVTEQIYHIANLIAHQTLAYTKGRVDSGCGNVYTEICFCWPLPGKSPVRLRETLDMCR